MKNSRPTQNIELTMQDGTTVSCTIKQPKSKLLLSVRAQVIAAQVSAENCSELYALTGGINTRLAAAQDNAAQVASRMPLDPSALAEADAAVGSIQMELKTVTDKINALNATQYELLFDQVALIVNVPNDDAGNVRTVDAVDWDETDVEDAKAAVGFFLNGPQK
jgi:hypothetical protein